MMAGRMLGPAAYGALSGILGFFVWIAVCSSAVQVVVAGSVSRVPPGGSWGFRSALTWSAGAALLVGTVALALAPLVTDFLRLPGWTIVLLAAYPLPALVAAVGRGVLQGHLRFGALAALTASTSVLRLGLTVVLLSWSRGIEMALIATLVAEICGAVGVLLAERSSLRGGGTAPDLLRAVWTTSVAVGGLWAIVSLDTVLARHHLDGQEAGFYSAGAIAARSVLFLPGAIAMAMFPRFVGLRHQVKAAKSLERHALVGVGLLAGCGAVILVVLRHPVIALMYGGEYRTDDATIVALAGAMVVFALANLVVHYNLSMGYRTWPAIAIAFVVEIVAVTVFHRRGSDIAGAMVLTAVTLLLSALLLGRASSRREVEVALIVPNPVSSEGLS